MISLLLAAAATASAQFAMAQSAATGPGPAASTGSRQAYPVKSIRLMVGFAPGGNVDISARFLAQKLTLAVGQPVVVDNRGGAGGILAADTVAKATPDGYTLLVASSGHAVNAALYEKLPYDTLKSFSPVSMVSVAPHVLMVPASLPVQSVKELIAHAKSKPGQINYGSGGTGSLTHLEGEYLRAAAGINIVHVPYKGIAQAISDMLGGQVQMVFTSVVSGLPFVKSGRARALAVTGAKRLSLAPDLPTVAELGLPQFVVDSATGVLASAGTPESVVRRLNTELVSMLKTPEIRELLASQGAEAVGSSAQEYRAKIAEDIVRWKKVVKDGGIPVQRSWL